MSRKFEKLLEIASDQMLVEPNWEGILECVDWIRGGEVPVKDAVKLIQKRYHNNNPHVAHHALLILEACVKNCGTKFQKEIATKECMDDLRNLLISNPPENVKQKILELIHCWSSAFRNHPEYKIVGDTHELLKMNGFKFPVIGEAKAMFLAESAPDWVDGDNCFRCRVEFGMFTRKHHCRACGQLFCDKCSNKQMDLPQYGIEKKVRVCESCFEQPQKFPSKNKSLETKSSDATNSDAEKARKEAEEQEQEELLLAIALSQSEAEAKEKEKRQGLYQHCNDLLPSSGPVQSVVSTTMPSGPSFTGNSNNGLMFPEDDPSVRDDNTNYSEQQIDSEFAKYLDRDYWERKKHAQEASAPPPSELSFSVSSTSYNQRFPQNAPGTNNYNYDRSSNVSSPSTLQQFSTEQNNPSTNIPLSGPPETVTRGDLDQRKNMMTCPSLTQLRRNVELEVAETAQFCDSLKERVNTMSNRMRSNKYRGRSIVNDTSIHTLFTQLTGLHGNVLQRIAKLEDERTHYEGLQDHIAHIQEARQAVNLLRERHERERQERLREQQNQRQLQLQQTLGLMRNKKQEMLLNERHAALQRFQENQMQVQQQRLLQQQQMLAMGTIPHSRVPQSPQQMGINSQIMAQFPSSTGQQPLPQQYSMPIMPEMSSANPPTSFPSHQNPSSFQNFSLSQNTPQQAMTQQITQDQNKASGFMPHISQDGSLAMAQMKHQISSQIPLHPSIWLPAVSAYGQQPNVPISQQSVPIPLSSSNTHIPPNIQAEMNAPMSMYHLHQGQSPMVYHPMATMYAQHYGFQHTNQQPLQPQQPLANGTQDNQMQKPQEPPVADLISFD